MPFIGLTGGFGSGKTTVLKMFGDSGAHVINADRIVHEILKRPSIAKRLAIVLGKQILLERAGKVSLNKKHMANIIFDDHEKRIAVEKIIHPEVIKTAKDIKRNIVRRDRKAVVVFEVPLLFEGGYRELFDKVVVVHCTRERAIERLKKTGISREQAQKRMKAQIPLSRKKAGADVLINNNHGIRETKRQVKALLMDLCGRS